jgi:hypothetical protein
LTVHDVSGFLDHIFPEFRTVPPQLLAPDSLRNNQRSVQDIWRGNIDARGEEIEYIYSRVTRTFAIYRAGGRVWIQYADDGQTAAGGGDLGAEQRKALAPLRMARGQIDGFLRKLAEALYPIDKADSVEIEAYNQRVADILFDGLQGNAEDARAAIRDVIDDITARLRSLARLRFARATLVATLITLAALTLFVFFVARIEGLLRDRPLLCTDVLTFMRENHIWAAGLFGSLGAWFSIALWLRSSDLRLSTSPLDNLVDPTLRIVIAVISAGVLFTIVQLGVFSFSFGEVELTWTADTPLPDGEAGAAGSGVKDETGWRAVHVAILLAFIAGFSERLVGNLLDSTVAANDPASAGRASGGSGGADASESAPMGRVGGGDRTGPQSGAPGAGPSTDAQDSASNLQPDEDLPDDPPDRATLEAEQTPDDALPASTGGVATTDVNQGAQP